MIKEISEELNKLIYYLKDNEKEKKINTISHVLGNISLKENIILDKVYLQVIESLEELATKNEESIISELNSFHHEKN